MRVNLPGKFLPRSTLKILRLRDSARCWQPLSFIQSNKWLESRSQMSASASQGSIQLLSHFRTKLRLQSAGVIIDFPVNLFSIGEASVLYRDGSDSIG